jgi:uncharacterized protein YegP (UPF0339 family)
MRTSIFALAIALFAVTPACAINADSTDGEDEVAETDDELTLTTGKFETFVGRDNQHYFHLLAGNGEKVLGSQGYATAAAAMNAIVAVQNNGVNVASFELRTATNGEFYFVLKAGNGGVIGVSETYVTKSNAERALSTVNKIVTRMPSVFDAPSGAKFAVFKGIDSKYYFNLRAANGEIVMQSQSYSARTSAVGGVGSVQTNGKIATRYELRETGAGQFYFVLKASNGAVIARGETYASKSNAQRGIATCVELLSAQ